MHLPKAHGLVTAALVTALVSVASAQEPDSDAPQSPPEVGQENPSPPPPPPAEALEVAVPQELRDHQVTVKTANAAPDGKLVTTYIDGKLVAIDEYEIIIETANHERITVDRSTILSVQRQADPPAAVVTPAESPSPWGVWGGLSGGPVWGGSSEGLEPAAAFVFDVAVSFHFVYVGTGLVITSFQGTSSGSPATGAGYLEVGLAKGLFFPYSRTESIELRPGIGYGYELMSSISDCDGCSLRSYDYDGGQYLRFQVGVYLSTHRAGSSRHRVLMSRNGLFVGPTVSLQHFLFASDRQVNNALMFGFLVGWGP
jgi:hypothetical protein